MTRLRKAGAQTFRAFGVRNFRLFFVGQIISVSGTWMHTVALGLLILSDRLHGSGFDVGMATALQYLPMLLFGTLGGLVADRVDKRRLLYATQAISGLLALALGLLTLDRAVTLWEVFLISGLLGIVTLFTNPTRQSFVSEMVGQELMPNAVSLNSVLMNSARVIGPAIGGVLIYTVGFAWCFNLNAASYIAVIVALAMMRKGELFPIGRVVRAKGQVREGLRYAWARPGLRNPLLVVALVGTLAFNFTTTLPLLAEHTFHGGPGTYSAFTVAMGIGAVVGGLFVAHRSRPSAALLGMIGLGFGVMIALVAILPTKLLTIAALVPMGVGSIAFIATANATVQLASDPSMRGRVMSLYATAFLGTTPIGAPLMGWISDATSPRVALVIGAASALVASVPLVRMWLRARRPAGGSGGSGGGAFAEPTAVRSLGSAPVPRGSPTAGTAPTAGAAAS